jgi:thiol-disulfide isomerase/thioredoxin
MASVSRVNDAAKRTAVSALSERYGVPRYCPMTASPFRRFQRAALLFLCWLSVRQGYGQQAALALDGKSQDPFAAASGRVVVLVFLRTDCPVSNRYAPAIQQIATRYQRESQFFLVFPAKSASAQVIRKYIDAYDYKLPALRDPQHVLVKQAHAQITPEVAVFDKRGVLVYHGRIDNLYGDFGRTRPAPTTHELDDAIQAAFKGTPVAVSETSGVGCYISDLQ